MGNRLSKIYTRTGDDGSTGLGDGSRVAKDSLRVGAYGTVDEANSCIGVVLAHAGLPEYVIACLTRVQHQLFDLGGELCIPGMELVQDGDIGGCALVDIGGLAIGRDHDAFRQIAGQRSQQAGLHLAICVDQQDILAGHRNHQSEATIGRKRNRSRARDNVGKLAIESGQARIGAEHGARTAIGTLHGQGRKH